MAFNKDRAIIAQNANQAAATILAASGDLTDVSTEAILDAFDKIHDHIFDRVLALAEVADGSPAAAEAAAQVIQGNFPGAEEVQQAQAPPPPAAPAAVATGGAPTCPRCGGPVYDNRAENQARIARGEKPRPDLKCKNSACGWLQWPPKG